jgi:hypothetical protein
LIRFLLVVILSGLSFALDASEQVIKCGDSKTTVVSSEAQSNPFFTLSFSTKKTSKSYQLSLENDFLTVRCDKKIDGALVLLFIHACGGSACNDTSNFGIIDVTTGEMLLVPNQRYKGNAAEAKKIMGKKIEPFTCTLNDHEGSNEKGEICFRSRLELG